MSGYQLYPIDQVRYILCKALLLSGVEFLSDRSDHVIGRGDKFGVTGDSQRVDIRL